GGELGSEPDDGHDQRELGCAGSGAGPDPAHGDGGLRAEDLSRGSRRGGARGAMRRPPGRLRGGGRGRGGLPGNLRGGGGGVAGQCGLAASVGVSALSLSPSSVTGGSSSTGTVSLNMAAPSGGVGVFLSSSGAVATVPSSVLVPQGQTSATFPVGTSSV